MPDFLDETRKQITTRLKELKPLVDEFNRLEAAEKALAGVDGTATATRTAPRRTRGSSGGGSSRRGRPRGTGTRAMQTLQLVQKQPGITIPQLAEAMGIKQNYLYRVLPTLQQEGKVRKSGRGWHAVENGG